MHKFAILVIALSLFVAGCEDPAANKERATVSNVANTTTASPAASGSPTSSAVPAAKGEAVAITPDNSKIEFTGSKVTGKHDGGFKQFTGTIDLVDGKAEGSTVNIEVDMASVFSDADGLTEHLKTGDFFLVEQFPKSKFELTKIAPDTAKGADNYTVSGNLELRGAKKAITFPATIKVSDADVTVASEFSINRKDFGIVYAGKSDDLIRDDVVIKLDIKAPRKK